MFLGDKQVNFWFLHYSLGYVQGVLELILVTVFGDTMKDPH